MTEFWDRAAHKSTPHSTLTDDDNAFFNHAATPEMKTPSKSSWRDISPSASPPSLSPERWLQLQPRIMDLANPNFHRSMLSLVHLVSPSLLSLFRMSPERKKRLEAIEKQRAQLATGDGAGQELVSDTVLQNRMALHHHWSHTP